MTTFSNRETTVFDEHWRSRNETYVETVGLAWDLYRDNAALDNATLGALIVQYWDDALGFWEDETEHDELREFAADIVPELINPAEIGESVREAAGIPAARPPLDV
jgi:hypothetical protein